MGVIAGVGWTVKGGRGNLMIKRENIRGEKFPELSITIQFLRVYLEIIGHCYSLQMLDGRNSKSADRNGFWATGGSEETTDRVVERVIKKKKKK